MNEYEDCSDGDADQLILEEIMKMMRGAMADKVGKPNVMALQMEGSPEEEASESPEMESKEGSEDLDLGSLENELQSKGHDPEEDEDDEDSLRKMGKIF